MYEPPPRRWWRACSAANASCFCYGATGLKDDTCRTVDDPGIMVLAFKNLFEAIDDDLDTDVTLTREIYNEALGDLLDQAPAWAP